jgi:DNA-binding response OmpR family regulator
MELFTILIIGSSKKTGTALRSQLQKVGFACTVMNGALDEEHLSDQYQLVVLDSASLSKAAAKDIVTRCHLQSIPVLALTPPGSVDVYDYTIGADDFLVNPVKEGELEIRAKHLIWKRNGHSTAEMIITGELKINTETFEVTVGDESVLLTFKEYQLLCLLASNPGKVFSREVLLKVIWDYDYLGGTRTVDVHIRRLRSKVEITKTPMIETVWNVGYRFKSR